MKKLIINVDDAGFSSEVNEAVDLCLRQSSVSGVSLMPSGMGFEESVRILKNNGFQDAGVHLALTGKSLRHIGDVSGIEGILKPDGTFKEGYMQLFKAIFLKNISIDGIYDEFKAQIREVRKKGLNLTHIDSHEHVHMLPGVLPVIISLAQENNIPYVRYPYESMNVCFKNFSIKDLFRSQALRSASFIQKVKLKRSVLKTNDFFLGHFHSGKITKPLIEYYLKNLREGVSEIAFHPAKVNDVFLAEYPQYSYSGNELELLLSDVLNCETKKNDIEIISHGGV